MQLKTYGAVGVLLLSASFVWAQEGDVAQTDPTSGSRESEPQSTQVSAPSEPRVSGPTTQPGVGFVGPTTPPPGSEQEAAGEEGTATTPWYMRAYEWILSLFN